MKSSLQSRPRSPRSSFLAAILLAGLTWVGCSDQATEPLTSPPGSPDLSARAGSPAAVQQQDLGPALAAQKRHGPQLMAISGVVGHGVGVDDDGNPTITVFTLQPGVSGIPARLDDVPTRTVVSGQFVAGELINPGGPAAPNGYSIGHPDITAGTLGAVVQKDAPGEATDGVCYILSNNHVLANINNANIGDLALQPGPFDGGSDPADAIGMLADFEPIAFDGTTNTIDAAIAEVFTPVADFVTAETPWYAPSSTLTTATIGLEVKKVGRTTELTMGQVTAINATTSVCYECSGPFCFRCKKAATFEGQVVTTDMSEGGDSGSLLVDTSDNPVGLLFAGSSTRTIHNPIGDVLERFKATVIQPNDLGSCTNGGGTVDNPPSVFITSPSDGATVSGTITVTADASDDNGVDQVEFFVDGSSIGVDSDGTNGWSSQNWDTTSETEGSHTVSATATDTNSQTTTDQITVEVDNVDDPPSVTITNPADGSTVSGNVTVTADATDDNGVNQVEFFVDATSIGVDTNGSDGWSASWDTSGEADGSLHMIKAVAKDTNSQTTTDDVTVTVDNSAPSTMHVGDLDGSKNVKGGSGNWEVFVTVTVHDESHNPVANATVSVSWSGNSNGSGFGVTGSDGTVTFGTGNIKGDGSVTFTVDAVSHSSLSYQVLNNHDTDGGSDGMSITVSKP